MSTWQNFRVFRAGQDFLMFNIRKRTYSRIDEIGYTIQTYFEKYKTKQEALKRERTIKAKKSRKYIESLILEK